MIPDLPIDIRIRLAELNFFLLLPDFANYLPYWLSQQNWPSQQDRKLAKSGSNKNIFQFCQSYSYVNRKVWYHQIWIPNNLGIIVSDLMDSPIVSILSKNIFLELMNQRIKNISRNFWCCTLPAKMFGGTEFWMYTITIIKIESHSF